MITGVSKVIVPIADQEAALRFWSETIGFSVGSSRPTPPGPSGPAGTLTRIEVVSVRR